MARGNLFFKIICVLMIIGAAISIILGIIGVIGCMIFADDPAYESTWSMILASAVIAVAAGILQLIAGIVGIRNVDKPENATTCIIFGAVSLAANIVDQLFSNSLSDASTLSTASAIFISLAIPILYMIGVILNKKEYLSTK